MDDSINPFKAKFWKIIGLPEKVSRRIDAFMDPRLGKLFHYPPRSLTIPENYTRVKKSAGKYLSISIVTPSFQGINYLEETIKSIVEQGYPEIEYIIQDGGSDDGTLEIIHHYKDKLHHWESRPDKGQSHAINLGFSHAHGEIMAYLNADDLLLPGSLQFINNYFVKHPDVDVVYGHRILIDSNSDEIGRWILPQHCHHIITWHDFIPQETLFWRRRIWEKAGGYIDENKHFAIDWDLILRFREYGARFVRLPRFLGAFRVHDKMKSIQNLDTIGIKEMNILREKYRSPEIEDKRLEKYIRAYLKKHIILDKLHKLHLLGH